MNARDREQFEEFMTSRWPGLVRLAFGLTGDRWLAEDLAQTALASAYASWWRVRRADDPDAYVRRILINASKGRFRRRRVSEQPAATAQEAAVSDPTASVDERSALLGALQELPPRQRAVVVLKYLGGLENVEIARILQMTVGTVKSLQHRGLASMRRHLARGGAIAEEPV